MRVRGLRPDDPARPVADASRAGRCWRARRCPASRSPAAACDPLSSISGATRWATMPTAPSRKWRGRRTTRPASPAPPASCLPPWIWPRRSRGRAGRQPGGRRGRRRAVRPAGQQPGRRRREPGEQDSHPRRPARANGGRGRPSRMTARTPRRKPPPPRATSALAARSRAAIRPPGRRGHLPRLQPQLRRRGRRRGPVRRGGTESACASSSTSSCSTCRAWSSRKLANRLQRRLLAQQTRAWEFDLEEGMLDAARLARVIVEPAAGAVLQARAGDRIPRHRGDAADRQFRLDARPPDHRGGDVRRHPGAHAGALRRQGRDPGLHHPRLEGRPEPGALGRRRQAAQCPAG